MTGSTTPISPLASTPKAAQAQPASAQRSDLGSSTARTQANTVPVMQAATPMSWLTYCAPTKKKGVVASTTRPTRATCAPCQRSRWARRAIAIAQASSEGPMRTAKSLMPNSRMDAMSNQYSSGGLWKKGRPSSVGTSRLPCSISSATPA